MAEKNNSLHKIMIDFALFIYSLFKIIPNFLTLVELEARILGESVGKILVLYLLAGTLLTSIWFCTIAMGFLFLVSFHVSWMLSLFIILIVNILLLIICGLLVKRAVNAMSFSKSRHLMRNISTR